MSRIGRILPLGVALLLASCADGTGPPQSPEQQPLGSVTGPGITTAELNPLSHKVGIVAQGEQPLFSEITQLSEGVPELDTYELSFWAKQGEPRGVEVDYADDEGDGSRFLRFHVPANGLAFKPDGSPFAAGDSVLISLSISRSEFVVEFGPSGLKFNVSSPAEFDVWYGGAEDDDVPLADLALWHQQNTDELWFPIYTWHDTEERHLETRVFHFSTYAVSW